VRHTPFVLTLAVAVSIWTPASAQDYATYCLPQAQLVLSGVELGTDSVTVRARLGTPLREVPDTSEDDGGAYPVRRLFYPRLELAIGRNKVELLSTTEPGLSLPSGIRVGMTIGEVGRRLGLESPAQYLRGDTLAPIACDGGRHSPGLAGLSLVFGPAPRPAARRLAKILLIEFGP